MTVMMKRRVKSHGKDICDYAIGEDPLWSRIVSETSRMAEEVRGVGG